LSFLIEAGIKPHFVVAVSAGALVAAKYIEGKCANARELELMAFSKFKNLPFRKNIGSLIRHPIRTKSLLNNDPLMKIINEIKFDQIFDSLIDFEISTTDILSREEKFFSNREIHDSDTFAKAILASTALPGFFKAVHIGKSMFIDGGMVEPLPIKRAIRAGCDTIIVIDADPTKDEILSKEFKEMGWMDCLARGYHTPIKRLSVAEIERTLQINERINAFKSLRHKLVEEFGSESEEKINQIFEETLKYFHYHENNKEIKLVVLCPEKPALKSPLKWTPEGIKKMILDGKNIAKSELKKAHLVE